MNTLFKTLQSIALCLCILLVAAPFTSRPVQADSLIDTLKKEIDKRNEEIKNLEEQSAKYNSAITGAQNQQKTLKNELSSLTAGINKLNVEIQITSSKIERTKIEIQQLSLEIGDLEKTIAGDKQGIGTIVRTISREEGQNLLMLVLKSNQFSDSFDQIKYLSNLNDQLLARLKAVKGAKLDLEDKKTEQEKARQDLESLATDLSDKKQINENSKKEKDSLLKKTKNQEIAYQNLLKETEQTKAGVEKDIETFEEKLRLAIDPKSLPPPKPGFFDWPVQGIVSSGYGPRIRPLDLGNEFHNGIDIAASIGTPVKSPRDGKVIALGDNDKYCYKGAYGKWIVIDHEDNLMTMYGHLSLQKVSVGQVVKQGDVIGLSGSTGFSTGPHLHFTVYDARTVDIHQSRVCGLLPYGGSIDPMTYLQ